MSELLVRPAPAPASDGTLVHVSPASAGWGHVGFEVLALAAGQAAARDAAGRECCVVVVQGTATVASAHGTWRELGGRVDPWSGPPDAAYLPPGTRFTVTADGGPAEIGLCWAPATARDAADARMLPGGEIEAEIRGHGALERRVHAILMADRPAASLLVCEVVTPDGHWSSYPPHKHDRDAMPAESLLEETYYHRVRPAQGFGLQRVYSDDRTLDETMAVHDRDTVLVPRGYHTVSAPPGYELYYLNVMAGPVRSWAVANDPDHAWTLHEGETDG